MSLGTSAETPVPRAKVDPADGDNAQPWVCDGTRNVGANHRRLAISFFPRIPATLNLHDSHVEEFSLSFPRTLILHSNNSYILPQLRDADQVPGGSRSYRCIHTSSQSHRRAPRNIGHVRNILQDSIIPPVKGPCCCPHVDSRQ